MLHNVTAYPRNQYGLIRQCAWCLAVANADGTYTLAAPALLPEASHGLCSACKAGVLREIDATPYTWELADRWHVATA